MSDTNNPKVPFDATDIDATVRIIKQAQKEREEEYLREKAQREQEARDEAAQRAIANSVGNTVQRILYDEKRKKELERKDKNKIKAIVATTLVLVSLTVGIVTVKGGEIKNDFQTYMKVDSYLSDLTDDKEYLLRREGLAVLDYSKYNPFFVFDNSVEDYKKLQVSSVEDVYLYMQILNDREFDKFIQAVSYYDNDPSSDTYGQKFYYKSFKQFLEKNGFKNKLDFINQIHDAYTEIMDSKDATNETINAKGGR